MVILNSLKIEKMKKINTIIISRTFYPIEGGIETYLLQVAKNLNFEKVQVFCRKEKGIPDLLYKPVKISRFNFKGKKYIPSLIILFKILLIGKFKFLIQRSYFFILMILTRSAITEIADFTYKIITKLKHDNFPIDVTQSSVPLYTGLISLILKFKYGSKFVLYIHGRELIAYKRMKEKLLFNIVFRYADIVISNSNYTKDLAVNFGCPKDKLHVINLGSDLNLFYPKDSVSKIKEKFNIPENHKIILTISHLLPRKGNDMVLKALTKVFEKFPNLTYLIGGRGDYQRELEKIVFEKKLSKNVRFIGFIKDDEINNIMNACDVFVMPNREEEGDVEGYGIVFMDANACGKPVVGGRSGGVTDAIIDGKNGVLVDPYSVVDIAKKIIYLLENPEYAKELGQNGLNLVRNERNWNIITDKIFNKILHL